MNVLCRANKNRLIFFKEKPCAAVGVSLEPALTEGAELLDKSGWGS